jgi:predicted metal-dependent enzyme (double-stranded beta helix superfamily)
MFELSRFVDDLRASLTDPTHAATREVIARVVCDPCSVVRELGEPDKAGFRILHRAPDLTVINAIWAPNQFAPPHEHRLCAVIGMYGGREDNVFWRRIPGRNDLQIEISGGRALSAGDVVVLGRDVIHSVINPVAALSAALHVYDGDFLAVTRSMWDSESLIEKPYDLNTVLTVPVEGLREIYSK